MTGAQRRPHVLGAALVTLLFLATGCGLPTDTQARPIDPAAVPYRLLDSEPWSRSVETEGPVPAGTPVVFWLTDDGRLAPTSVDIACTDPSDEVAEGLLALLSASPDETARSVGKSSAVPPSSELELVDVADGVALVRLDAATSLTADRLPLAVGQLVLTVTSAPGIDAVRVGTGDDLVEVPLPGGALTSRPVTAADYASLLPGSLSPDLGCAAPAVGAGG